jgi:KH domain
VTAGAALKFELAVGLNGRVWVAATDTTTTILVANAIQHSEPLSEAQAHIFVKVRSQTSRLTHASRLDHCIQWHSTERNVYHAAAKRPKAARELHGWHMQGLLEQAPRLKNEQGD